MILLIFSFLLAVPGVWADDPPAIQATYNGDWAKLRGIIAKAPYSLGVVDNLGRSALMTAARNASPEGVQIILAANPRMIGDADYDGMDALMYAAENGSTSTLKVLLDAGADPQRQDRMGMNALMHALSCANHETTAALIKAGSKVNARVRDLRIMEFTQQSGSFSHTYTSFMTEVKAKESPTWRQKEDGTGWTPLFFAAYSCWKCQQDIAALAAAGADLEAQDSQGRTALILAAQAANVDSLEALLDAGADPTTKNLNGKTALDLARGATKGMLITAKPRPKPAPAAPAPVAAALVEAAPEKKISSDVDVPGYRREEDPRKFAIVVGIEKYKSLPAARFAERDAEAMRHHLESLGYPKRHIIYLTGDGATRSALSGYLKSWLAKNVKEDSEVFFYFSGHGAPDAESKKAFLIPWDGSPEFLADSGYALEELYAGLSRLKAARVVVALDSCFSGAGGRSVLPKDARPLITKVDLGAGESEKLVVLAAAAGSEITGSQAEQGHGLFTYYLLKGLEKSKGEMDVKALYEFLKPKVMDDARLDNREQTPQLLPAGAASRARALKL